MSECVRTAARLVSLGAAGCFIFLACDNEASAQTSGATPLPPVTVQSPTQRRTSTPADSKQTQRRTAATRSRKPNQTAARPAPVSSQSASAEATNGNTTDYVATRGGIGTKTNTPLIEIPQAVSVVTRKQMDDQNVQNVAEALRYTPGVVAEQRGINEAGLEYLYGRGFLMDTYWNGLRLPSGNTGSSGYNIVSVDPYFLQSIQVLHGPASVLYGQASPGGIVDLTSKLPPSQPLHEVFVETGSYGRIQGGFDLGGPVDQNGQLFYRLTGEGFNTGTQVNSVDNQRVAIAPSLTWRPDMDTTVTVSATYQNDPKAGIYNFVPATGTVLSDIYGRLPKSFNPGDPSFDSHSRTQESIGYKIEHRVDDVLTLRQNFRYLSVDDSFKEIFGNGVAANQSTLNRYAFVNNEDLNYLTVDNQAQFDFNTWVFHHTVLVGADYTLTTGTEAYGLGAAPSINMYAPVYGMAIATPAYSGIEHFTQNRTGTYAQDQIKIGGLSILIGGRQDWFNSFDYEQISMTTQRQDANPFTWRTGAVYEFNNGIAPYVSYETAFQPNESMAFGGAFLAPTTGQQYEGGVKYQPPSSKSFFTAAVFNLTEQNVATPDPLHPTFSVSTGEINSRGVELEAHVNVNNNINLIASYTYDEAIVTQSNTTNLGKVPVGIPENMASLWGTYRFNSGTFDGLQLGGGIRYVGETWGTTTNTFQVPAFTLVDLSVQYDLGGLSQDLKNYHASVNVTNLFDKYYIASCTSLTNCNMGLGRQIMGKLAYRW